MRSNVSVSNSIRLALLFTSSDAWLPIVSVTVLHEHAGTAGEQSGGTKRGEGAYYEYECTVRVVVRGARREGARSERSVSERVWMGNGRGVQECGGGCNAE